MKAPAAAANVTMMKTEIRHREQQRDDDDDDDDFTSLLPATRPLLLLLVDLCFDREAVVSVSKSVTCTLHYFSASKDLNSKI